MTQTIWVLNMSSDQASDLRKGAACLNLVSELVFILNHVIPYRLKLLQSIWCQESRLTRSRRATMVSISLGSEKVHGVACCSV